MSKLLYPQWSGWIWKNTWEAPMHNKQNAKNTNLYRNVECQTVYHENVSFEWHLESGIPAKNEKLLGCFKIKSFL